MTQQSMKNHELCSDKSCLNCNATRLENLKNSASREQQKYQSPDGKFSAWWDPEASLPKTVDKPIDTVGKSTEVFYLRNDFDKTRAICFTMDEELPVSKIFSYQIENEGIAGAGGVIEVKFIYDVRRAPNWRKGLDAEGVIVRHIGFQIWDPMEQYALEAPKET